MSDDLQALRERVQGHHAMMYSGITTTKDMIVSWSYEYAKDLPEILEALDELARVKEAASNLLSNFIEQSHSDGPPTAIVFLDELNELCTVLSQQPEGEKGCPSCHGAMYHRFKYGNKLPKMCAACSECPTCCDCEPPEGEGGKG